MNEKIYIAPSQEIFDDLKKAAISIWRKKISQLENIDNILDNAACIVAMFNSNDQNVLYDQVEEIETTEWLDGVMS